MCIRGLKKRSQEISFSAWLKPTAKCDLAQYLVVDELKLLCSKFQWVCLNETGSSGLLYLFIFVKIHLSTQKAELEIFHMLVHTPNGCSG